MNKKPYTAPTLAVVSVKTEHGYALSTTEGTPLSDRLELMMYEQGNDTYRETEVFSTHDTWVKGNSDSFWE